MHACIVINASVMQIIEIYRVQCFDVSRQLVHQREVRLSSPSRT